VIFTFEGYFCHSREKNDDWRYEPYLCKLQPVVEIREDTVIVPPKGATWDDIMDSDDVADTLTPGKKYRITIEEID